MQTSFIGISGRSVRDDKEPKCGKYLGKKVSGMVYMILRNNLANKTAYLKEKDKGRYTACLTKQSLILGGYDESAGVTMMRVLV